ncbi:hypothetical protein DICA4_C05160 [Diutina catenulata]
MATRGSPIGAESPPSLAPKIPIPRNPPAKFTPAATPRPRPTEVKSAGTAPTQIITSKEWVLPPRPKPGRKPSVDTPASKRKAQNRAAQRAFRERRATRVQELEEKLMEVEKEKEMKEMQLVSSLNKLKGENSVLSKTLEQMKRDINMLKRLASNSSQAPSPNYGSNGPSPLTMGSPGFQQISPAPSADSPRFHGAGSPRRASQYGGQSSPQDPYYPSFNAPQRKESASYDCGICIKEDCLCETVGIKSPAYNLTSSSGAPQPNLLNGKSSQPPSRQGSTPHLPLVLLEQTLRSQLESYQPEPAVQLSRKRKSDAMEIDFTAKFSKKVDLSKLKKPKDEPRKSSAAQLVAAANSLFNKDSPVDSCGFCSDDTPCVCREAAEEAARLSSDSNALPPLNNPSVQRVSHHESRKASLPVLHPGPSLEISNFQNLAPNSVPLVTSSEQPTPKPQESKPGCTGNPGTCGQCQADPLSTLFCSTVASKAQETSAKPSPAPPQLNPSTPTNRILMGTPGGPGSPAPLTPGAPVNGPQGLYIPCADAYKTLSRHKHFSQVDFSTLVGKLTTRGMQVEVQSVANVLRELDRNLYN